MDEDSFPEPRMHRPAPGVDPGFCLHPTAYRLIMFEQNSFPSLTGTGS